MTSIHLERFSMQTFLHREDYVTWSSAMCFLAHGDSSSVDSACRQDITCSMGSSGRGKQRNSILTPDRQNTKTHSGCVYTFAAPSTTVKQTRSGVTQQKMHPVFDRLLESPRFGGAFRRLEESRRNVLLIFACSKLGAAQPEGHGVQDGRPGVAVVEPCCVYRLWGVKSSTCEKDSRQDSVGILICLNVQF